LFNVALRAICSQVGNTAEKMRQIYRKAAIEAVDVLIF